MGTHRSLVPRILAAGDADVRNARRVGQFDMTDLGVGIALLLIVPFFVYFIGALFIEDHTEERMGSKATVDAPPDQDEINLYLQEAAILLKINAPHYLKLMKVTTDGQLRDKYRHWAQRALEEGLSKLDEVRDFMIPKHPQGSRVFGADLQRIAQLRSQAQAELERIRQLDILGSS